MPRNILIVEDNDMNLDILVRRLAAEGYATICANTGEQARQQIKQFPDLVLLDMMLPDAPGWVLAKEWRESGDCNQIPIIGVSAMAFEHEVERALKAGCDAYMTKPVNYRQLFLKIRELLDGRELDLE